ncbi:Alpha/Beta hydrolase protein [Scheffersomyces amazonensis]|uniref:Alpha/Beta hydrolase protein n=1 Tax=Scheffersomyces amazonensis TaxID=1078765 RepID=UPI00315D522A
MFNFGTGIIGSLFKIIKMIAEVGVSVGALALLGIYTYQNKLIYPASMNDGHGYCATPDEYEMPNYESINLITEDGETLQCYSIKHDINSINYSNKTVLILSPNAGNIGHALPIVSIFYNQFGYNVFIYSYRGYGRSTGTASEHGLKIDAQRVIKYLTEEDEQYQQSSIVLYGRSLGGAVAIYIAATMSQAISGLILENTFLSIRKTVPHVFPLLKYFTSFVHQNWDSEKLVPLIPAKIPVILLSARNDEIVPPSHMDAIYSRLKSEDKVIYKFENSNHNDTVIQPQYWERIQQFIQDKVNPVGY